MSGEGVGSNFQMKRSNLFAVDTSGKSLPLSLPRAVHESESGAKEGGIHLADDKRQAVEVVVEAFGKNGAIALKKNRSSGQDGNGSAFLLPPSFQSPRF